MSPIRDLSVAGAILTGGASRRMGRDKAFVVVDGHEMVLRVAAVLRTAGCSTVLAIGGDARRLGEVGLDVVDDQWPGEGPLGGIITALAATSIPTLVVATDLAWLDLATIELVLGARSAAADVVIASSPKLEPLCACWEQTARPVLIEQFERGERAVHATLQHLRVMSVAVSAAALGNVNTPQDLAAQQPG